MKYIDIEPYDFPIQFKEFNYSDFENYIFDEEKTIITPDEDGYISNELLRIIDLDKKDTTVINAGVGLGKTTAIGNIILKYYNRNIHEEGNYKIIIITPFKSLNNQYIEKIIELGKKNDIYFDYQDIETSEWDEIKASSNSRKPIQLISIMSILGDSGQDGFEQNENKGRYYDYLIGKCQANNEKVILFFDEIHESSENFKQKLLPYLFKWKPVTHKIYVASATFSESSKTVIKFFAEITDKKIRIIEAKRNQKKDVSDLFLCFNNRPTVEVNDFYLRSLFDEILDKDYKTINVLTYSKSLAQEIYNSSIGTNIKEKYRDLNLVIPNEDKFNQSVSNIGTLFKTGISIEIENTAFVVMLPPSFSQSNDKFGIFSDRLNSLVQALARPRSSTSSIYVIMSIPNKLILRPEANSNYIEQLSLGYLDFNSKDRQVPYLDVNQQDVILREHYDSKRGRLEEEINTIYNLNEEIRSLFDSYDWFRLKEGDGLLTPKYDIFGKNLSNYIYWAAWNNQFVNCKLKSIIKKDYLSFTEDNILKELDEYIPISMLDSESFYYQSDKEIFDKVYAYIYSHNLYLKKVDEIESVKVTPSRIPLFNQQIIRLLQRRKTPYLFPNEENLEDKPISKEKYIRLCISQCQYILGKEDSFSDDEKLLIGAYNDLFLFRDILLRDDYCIIKKNRTLLPRDNDFKFKAVHLIKLKKTFSILKDKDICFKFFSTQNLLIDKSIYSLLRKVFFSTSETTYLKKKHLKIDEIIEIEYSEYPLNLVYKVPEPHVYFPYPPNDTTYCNIEIAECNGEILEDDEGYIYAKKHPLEEDE